MNQSSPKKTPSRLALCLSVGLLIPGLAQPEADSSCANLESLAWLLGHWRAEAHETVFMEHWSLGEDGRYIGHAEALTEGGGATNFENLWLEERPSGLFYVAHPSQNPAPVDFMLVECSPDTFRFENPEHDFPQVIQYDRMGEGKIQAHVMTLRGDGFKLQFESFEAE